MQNFKQRQTADFYPETCGFFYLFIPVSNEPSGNASISIWRLPRGSIPRSLLCYKLRKRGQIPYFIRNPAKNVTMGIVTIDSIVVNEKISEVYL